MGSLLKARRRAQSRANSKARRARDKVSQGGRFASKDDRNKSSKNQGGQVQQGGRFVSQQMREQQLADKFKNANLNEIIAAQRRGEIDARIVQQSIQKGIQERRNKTLAQARSSQNRGAARRQAMQDVKAAKASQQNIQQAIKDKKQAIADTQIKLAKNEAAWEKAGKSRAQIRRGNQGAVSIRNSIKSLQSQLSQLVSASTKSQGVVDQATKQRQHVEATVQFGGFSSKRAQDAALKQAIAASKLKNPEAFAKATQKASSIPGKIPKQLKKPLLPGVQAPKLKRNTPDTGLIAQPANLSQLAKEQNTVLVGNQTQDPVAAAAFTSQSVISPLPNLPNSIEELTEKSIVSNPIKDVGDDPNTQRLAGVADPFVNFGITVANIPGAVVKEVQALQEGKYVSSVEEFFGASPAGQMLGSTAQTPGSKFQKEIIEPELVATASSDVLSGKMPDLNDPRKQGSVIGDLALILAPAIGGKLKGSPKPVDPSKVIKNVQSQNVPTPKGQKVWTPTNPFRDKIPLDVFDLDKAIGSSFKQQSVKLGSGQGAANPFTTTEFPLGIGLGSIFKPGGLPTTPKYGNFPTTKGGGTFSKPVFDEPTIKPGDNILDTGKGTQQIAKTKQDVKTKQETKQVAKQESEIIPSKQQSVVDDILFSKPRFNTKKKLKQQEELAIGYIAIPKAKQKSGVGLDWIYKQTPKQGQKSGSKQKQKQDIATGFIATPKQTPALKQPPIQDQSFAFVPPYTPTTTQTVIPPPKPPTVIPKPPGFFLPFFGGGIQGGDAFGRKRGSKRFIVSNVDPLRAGVIAAVGVPEQQESRSSSIFTTIDEQLKESRSKKSKQPKPISLLSDPLGDNKKSKKNSDIGLGDFDFSL